MPALAMELQKTLMAPKPCGKSRRSMACAMKTSDGGIGLDSDLSRVAREVVGGADFTLAPVGHVVRVDGEDLGDNFTPDFRDLAK